MSDEARPCALRHTYEFGSATIIVVSHSGTALDGLVKVKFACHVHPTDGGEVRKISVRTFYPFLAASKALEIFEKQRNDSNGNHEN